ncbi:type VII secretion protein EccB [Tessaracoccus antarcticus]|uniref:Type VII secretion protein EccB n=1 Tax=Tessaracoccus antarcticus TaxID=2479848 RepID=A0A3M0GJG4_9ACTN|nr:type VII secretion protein EccB [Tessaracoccus antarcticus]RMB61259.1 type VII secretion protein EccB [Tessaracoccus antarcticus]
MATRKDLLKAQSFISRRMVAAFVDRDPDDPTPPLRRVGTASFVSVLLGVVLLAGTALIGLIRPGGGDAWQEEGVVVSDTTAGMLFVYSGGSLIPMADVASARLQAGGVDAGGQPRVVKVSTEKLKGTPQLPMHGIPGAPRQLPAPDDLQAAPLRLCSSKPNSREQRFVSLEFNVESPTGDPFSVVAETSDQSQYLIANGRAHKLWKAQGDVKSPLVEDLPTISPGNLWMSAIPVGDPMVPMKFPAYGATPSKNPLSMPIGSLAEVKGAEGGITRYYVQLDQGLSQVSYLDMRLIQATQGANDPRPITESDLARARNNDIPASGNQDINLGKPTGPADRSALEDASICATFTDDDAGRVALSIDVPTPAMPPEHQTPFGNSVDHVEMPELSGALLRASAAADDAPTFLILAGLSYPIPDAVSRRALGYGDVTPTVVPGQLINLFTSGLAADTNLSLGMITQVP